MKKKALSLLLALAMCLSLLPSAALAAEGVTEYDIWVGGTQVTSENMDDVLLDGTVSYDPDSGVLFLNSAEITGGYRYSQNYNYVAAIYANVEGLGIILSGRSTITAPDDVELSCGIRAKGDLIIAGDGDLIVKGGNAVSAESAGDNSGDADSFGICTSGMLTISAVDVTAYGGSATGTEQATSAAVSTDGGLTVCNGGYLDATAGEAKGKIALSDGVESFGNDENVNVYCTTIKVEDGFLSAHGGNAEGSEYAESTGIYTYFGSLFLQDGANVALTAGEATGSGSNSCLGAYLRGGDLSVFGGELSVNYLDGGDAYTWGIYVDGMELKNGGINGGNVEIRCFDDNIHASGTYGFSGTEVNIKTENGVALSADGEIKISDNLTIREPENGSIQNGTIMNAAGKRADSVTIDVLTYKVHIEGLTKSGIAVPVPSGWSVNEGYCEKYHVSDFSEFLASRTQRENDPFLGYYTEHGREYSFDTPVTRDITITAKWASDMAEDDYEEPSWQPTVEDAENGGITVSPKWAEAGDKVTITAKPDEGYVVDTVTVTTRGGKTVKVTDNGDGTYSFTQPTGTVTIEVSFVPETVEAPEELPDVSFPDVKKDDWCYSAVQWAVSKGITNGMDNGSFGSELEITREQLAVMLYRCARLLGSDTALGGMAVREYDDYESISDYAKQAMTWAVTAGLIGGNDGKLMPFGTATREQLVTILYRYAQYMGFDTTQGGMAIREFDDYESISDYALPAMTWAVNAGILSGTGGNLVAPQGAVTRAQAVTLLMNWVLSMQ